MAAGGVGGGGVRSPSQIMWEEAGRPEPSHEPGDMSGPCCVCGAPYHTGFDRDDGWSIPKNDTSQELFRAHTQHVCTPCVWVSKGNWADHFRLWSPCYSEAGGMPDHYSTVYEKFEKHERKGGGLTRVGEVCKKAEDRLYIGCRGSLWPHTRLMLDPPDGEWFAVVSESGKKNLIRHASTNRGGGRWRVQFELTEVVSDPVEMASILHLVCAMRDVGFSKKSILSATPNPTHIFSLTDDYGMQIVDAAESACDALRPWAQSRKLALALYLEHEDYRDDIQQITDKTIEERPGGDEERGRRARESAARLHSAQRKAETQDSDEVLGLGAEGTQDRSGQGHDVRPDGDRSEAPTPDSGSDTERRERSDEPRQQALFDA